MNLQVKSYTKKDGTKVKAYRKNRWGVYVSDRRTPIVVSANLTKRQAVKKALLVKKRGSNKVDLVRRLTDAENAIADKGKWVKGHNVDKDRKKLIGKGPTPKSIGFNLSSSNFQINFAKPFRGLKKEQLQKLVKAGKNWTKKNRLNSSKYPELVVHDTMHTIGEHLRPEYKFAPLNPKLIKSRLKGTQEIVNPYGVAQELDLRTALESKLTKKRNMKAESYIAGLEGSKKIDKNLDFDLTVQREPNRKELEAYWKGRRDRKKKLPKEYQVLQRQERLRDSTLKQVVKEVKPDLEVRPAGSFKQTKSHPRRSSSGKVTRVRAFRSRKANEPKSDFEFDLDDFL
jgi:hypothetical protein